MAAVGARVLERRLREVKRGEAIPSLMKSHPAFKPTYL
jgi:hypothetical protein